MPWVVSTVGVGVVVVVVGFVGVLTLTMARVLYSPTKNLIRKAIGEAS